MTERRVPSSLEPQSRGGETSEQGFAFQESILLAFLPYWLSFDGFFSVIRESIGDIEIAMFAPGKGVVLEFLEIKDYRLTPAPFWEEISRFIAVDEGSPGTFQWYRIVAHDVSEDLKPLLNGLRRVRSAYGFYELDSGVVQNSVADYRDIVRGLGKNDAIADFLFTRVLIDTTVTMGHQQGLGLFLSQVTASLPEFSHLAVQTYQAIYQSLRECMRPVNTPILRRTIEAAISQAIPEDQRSFIPIRVFTANQPVDNRRELVLNWSDFAGSDNKEYPAPERWNDDVIGQLVEVKNFAHEYRTHRHLRITGSRRLSASLGIGAVFSATSGFIVEMEYRDGDWWKTNDHARTEEHAQLFVTRPNRQGAEVVISIGIPRNIGQTVENYLQRQDAADVPILNITYSQPITSAREANAIVARIKDEVLHALTITNAKQIHLFCAVPAFIALLLGHRLNATAPLQCYEFVPPDNYVPTCFLRF